MLSLFIIDIDVAGFAPKAPLEAHFLVAVESSTVSLIPQLCKQKFEAY